MKTPEQRKKRLEFYGWTFTIQNNGYTFQATKSKLIFRGRSLAHLLWLVTGY